MAEHTTPDEVTRRGEVSPRSQGHPTRWWLLAIVASLIASGVSFGVFSLISAQGDDTPTDWFGLIGWVVATIAASGLAQWRWAVTAGCEVPPVSRWGLVVVGTFGPIGVVLFSFVVYAASQWPSQ